MEEEIRLTAPRGLSGDEIRLMKSLYRESPTLIPHTTEVKGNTRIVYLIVPLSAL